jgi:uncharacterized damage-inducible protein DinB
LNQHLSPTEIQQHLQAATTAFTDYCTSLTEEQFFMQPPGKWSAAQQAKHLVTATNTARYAFTLPAFIVRLVGGKPNRASRTYDELVTKYKLKLEQGGRAGKRYIPKPIPPSYGKEKLLKQFGDAMQKFGTSITKNRTDATLDQYLAPHPLLGKITLRELCYFTIYHIYHHKDNISRQLNSPPLS